jgi:glycosyltransferase involved in cell wall biosynthesis
MEKEEKLKQRILIFHPALAPYRIDQFNLLNELFDLEVVFLFDRLRSFSIDQQNMVEACNFKISYLLIGPTYKSRLFRFGMLRTINRVKPDIVLGYEYSFTTQYLILLKRLGLIKQRIGSFVDDSLHMCVNPQSKTRELARNYSLKYIDLLVVMSQEVASFLCNHLHFPENKIIISPILQLPERLRKNREIIEGYAMKYFEKYNLEGKKVALYVGRFIPEKALSLFIKKIAHLLSENNDYRLVLVGDGLEKENLIALVQDYKLEDKIIFPGKYQADELYGWYVSASGFVLPSLFEPFGAVVNEALIFGLPVLCSKYAGASTLINEYNGLLFDPSDDNDTLQKFHLFMENTPVLNRVDLNSTPPLIEDYQSNFKKEWRKVNYE